MTLISMLIALIVERLAVRSDNWQFWPYARKYLSWSQTGPLATLASDRNGQYLWLLLPGVIYGLVLWLFDNGLLTLICNTLVLLVSIGCWHYRQLYKHYLNATERGDNEAAFLSMAQIANDVGLQEAELSYGQRLVWLNFRYYAAVLFWFAVLGGAGALTYALIRQLSEPMMQADVVAQPQQENAEQADESWTADDIAPVSQDLSADQSMADDEPKDYVSEADEPASAEVGSKETSALTLLMFWADWLPARLFGLGLALVGHFSRASASLLGFLGNTSAPASMVITTIARAAEPLPDESYNCCEETACMVQLSKRNVLFFLALVAVLTLSGWLG